MPSRFIFLQQAEPHGRRYLVEDRQDTTTQPGGPRNLGLVRTVEMPSHVRRGRSQASPWWIAFCLRGHAVPHDHQLPQLAGRWITRERAAESLLQHVRLTHGEEVRHGAHV